MMNSVTFIFPHIALGPTGGYKVVYEYANRLVNDGVVVHIVYSGSVYWKQKPLRFKLSNVVRYLQTLMRGYSAREWFPLDKRVKEHLTLSMNYRHVPKTDVYVATSPYTAWYLNDYPVADSKKFYFIQGKEDWGPGIKAILEDTYHMPLRKIAVARWLQNMIANNYGEECVFIPNGFDFEKFRLTILPENKNKYSISVLYHTQELKRCADAIAALKIVKQQIPALQVNVFGVPNRPEDLPDWFIYYQAPDSETHNRINNESAIYIGSSITEGWCLTVGEAMICGQAVCCTDIDGYTEMAHDGETALLSPILNPEVLAKNIITLIEDDELRIKIAYKGNEFIQQFRWEASYRKFYNQLFSDKQ